MKKLKKMSYSQLKGYKRQASKDTKMARGVSFDFPDTLYLPKGKARAIHVIMHDTHDGFINVAMHKSDDNKEVPCTNRSDCPGCSPNIPRGEDFETIYKFGVTAIAAEYFHVVQRESERGTKYTTVVACPNVALCEICVAGREGEERIFGRKLPMILPTTQREQLVDIIMEAARTCRACGGTLAPVILLCPRCGKTLLQVSSEVSFNDTTMAYLNEINCPTCGSVEPDSQDVCVDDTGEMIDCEVNTAVDMDNHIIVIKKTDTNFPVLESKSFRFEDFWNKNPDLTPEPLPEAAFYMDWDPEQFMAYLTFRRKRS